MQGEGQLYGIRSTQHESTWLREGFTWLKLQAWGQQSGLTVALMIVQSCVQFCVQQHAHVHSTLPPLKTLAVMTMSKSALETSLKAMLLSPSFALAPKMVTLQHAGR